MRKETKELYPGYWLILRTAIIKRNSKVCADCGARKGHTYKVLTVHHIDYDPSNNSLANLVVLCQGCHLRRQARDLSQATKYNNTAKLIRMGQLCFHGMEPGYPKRLDRVVVGKALNTRQRMGYRALPGTGLLV